MDDVKCSKPRTDVTLKLFFFAPFSKITFLFILQQRVFWLLNNQWTVSVSHLISSVLINLLPSLNTPPTPRPPTRGLLHSPFLVWKSDLFLSNKSSENNDALAVWFTSTLTAQIAGVNLWHGISRSQAALFVLRHVGGRSRVGKGRGAKKKR